jgi:RNA polymerase sigma-70 factor (ECF subfamily)
MSERLAVRAEVGGLTELLLSHLDAAYNLARWLVRNGDDAEDVVQEAYLRAFQYSGGFRGGDARAWLLTIVRNTAYRWLRKTRAYEPAVQFDEELHTSDTAASSPEELLLKSVDGRLVEKALSELPHRFREILVLRELEDLSYKEIAAIMDMPIGTVMSTLSRAREKFRDGAGRLIRLLALPRVGPGKAGDLPTQEVSSPDERGSQMARDCHKGCRTEQRASVHKQPPVRFNVARPCRDRRTHRGGGCRDAGPSVPCE